MRSADPDAGPHRNKKRKQETVSGSSTSFTGTWKFVQSSLSDAEKASVKEWLEDTPDLLDFLSYYAKHGIKITVSYQESTSSYICAATCKNPASVNLDHTFSSHHRTAALSLAVTIWKLEFKLTLDQPWSETKTSGEDWG